MKKLIIPFCVLLLASCGNNHQPESGNTETPAAETTPAVPETSVAGGSDAADAASGATAVSNDVSFNGTLVVPPQSHASVTLSIDGIVKSTSLLSGKYVRKGEVLATLENPEFINLQQEYIEATAQCDCLESEYKRQEFLSKEEVASQKRFEQSKADYISTQSRKDATAARLRMLGVDPGKLPENGIIPLLEVRAPINGYISSVQLNLGKFIPAGEALCEIVDKSSAMLRLTAYEKDVDRLNVGDPVEFRVNGILEETFDGTIISVGQQVDNVNRSLEVYVRVSKTDSRFRPGMYVNATVAQK